MTQELQPQRPSEGWLEEGRAGDADVLPAGVVARGDCETSGVAVLFGAGEPPALGVSPGVATRETGASAGVGEVARGRSSAGSVGVSTEGSDEAIVSMGCGMAVPEGERGHNAAGRPTSRLNCLTNLQERLQNVLADNNVILLGAIG